MQSTEYMRAVAVEQQRRRDRIAADVAARKARKAAAQATTRATS